MIYSILFIDYADVPRDRGIPVCSIADSSAVGST